MTESRKKYEGRDAAFIIPTKDRPEKIKNLLASLKAQTLIPGRIIIIDGGKSVESVVREFGSLPVEHYTCNPPGQIRQRNMGIGLLDDRTRLVGFLDDDIVLEADAFEKMIDFWNESDLATAGIGFNNISIDIPGDAGIFSRLMPHRKRPGKVLRSGLNTSFENISSHIKTQWLGGGYTIWRQDILSEFTQDVLNTRWATGEDLRFSYPIGKKYPLYVCASARVRHEHVFDQAPKAHIHRYQGRKEALAIFYFVSSHSELSRLLCLSSLSVSAFGKFIVGVISLNSRLVRFAAGRAEGIFICLRSLAGLANIRKEMED
ncbi:MAG: glycosyltransferase family 2 protein [Syntrophorhabdaceae bacterium]